MILHSAQRRPILWRRWPSGSCAICSTPAWTAGQSVRTVSQACSLALEDATIATSLIESRFLAGSGKLFQQLSANLSAPRCVGTRPRLIDAIEQARRAERSQYGETVYLLEPNIKRSRGGLRDHAIAALGRLCPLRHGRARRIATVWRAVEGGSAQRAAGPANFCCDCATRCTSYAGKSSDVLDKTEQLRLAAALRLRAAREAILPVEQFMQEYFRHTQAVRSIVSRFVEQQPPARRPVARCSSAGCSAISSKRDFRVGPRQIAATMRGLAKLRTDLERSAAPGRPGQSARQADRTRHLRSDPHRGSRAERRR